MNKNINKYNLGNDFLNKTMEITAVIGCRNNCSYCPQNLLIHNYLSKSNKTKFTLEDFKTCLSKIPKDVRIDFSGMAEPFLNPNCTEMILHTFSEGYPCTLFTTLIGLTKENYLRIKELPFITICVHLPDDENKTNIVIDKHYIELLDFIIKNKPKTEISFIYFNSIQREVSNLLKKHDIYLLERKINNRGGNLKKLIRPKTKKGKHYCSGSKLLHHNVLLPSGDVALCCMDYGLNHILGNLITGDYSSLFGKEHKKIINSLNNGGKGTLCNSCEICIKTYSIENLNIKIKNQLRKINLLTTIKRKLINNYHSSKSI